MQHKNITLVGSQDGISCPYITIPFINTVICAIGCDFDRVSVSPGTSVDEDGNVWETVLLGKLMVQPYCQQYAVARFLLENGWDYKTFPNPELCQVVQVV